MARLTEEDKKKFIGDNINKVAERFRSNYEGFEALEGEALDKKYTGILGVLRRQRQKEEKTTAEAYKQAEVSVNDFFSKLKNVKLGVRFGLDTASLKDLKAELAEYDAKIDELIEANKEADIEAKRKAVNEAIDAYNAISGENKEHI